MSTLGRMQLTVGDLIKGGTLLATIIVSAASVVWQLSAVRNEISGLRVEIRHLSTQTDAATTHRSQLQSAVHELDIRLTTLEAHP